MAAWSKLSEPISLKIVGDGPLADSVRRAAHEDDRITWLGPQRSDQVVPLVGDAACLIMPSVWYECFPRTILEALAKGTPIIASRLGSMTELIDDGRTGLHFKAGHPDDLAAKVQHFFAHPSSRTRMRRATRQEYEQKYTADRNYQILMQIYDHAIHHRLANRPIVHAAHDGRQGKTNSTSIRGMTS